MQKKKNPLTVGMKLNDIQKKRIEEDLAAFTCEYAGKTKEERKAKGQFFTPAVNILY